MKALLLLVLVTVCSAVTNLDASARGQTILVSAILKTAAHPNFGFGNPNGFALNGIEGANLLVTAGETYTFDLTGVACNHPFYFTFDASGQNVSAITQGIVSNGYDFACRTTSLKWTIPANLTAQTVYYNCRVHSKMGYTIQVKPPTICNKYSNLLNITNLQLIQTVITNVVGIITQPTHPLSTFFDGTTPPGSTNFTSPSQSVAFTRLFTNLVSFFGAALGCTSPTFPAYAGNPDLHAVHQAMDLDNFEFNTFNGVVDSVLQTAGVTPPDRLLVQSVLISTKPLICTVGACAARTSICDRYADALNLTDVDLVRTIVISTFTGLIASPLRPYFEGTANGTTTNYITNIAAQTNLVGLLTAFFGQTGVLSCTDPGYPAYTGRTLKAAHAPMIIGLTEFNLFNSILAGVVTKAGVTATDVASIGTVLESTKPDVCTYCNRTQSTVAATFILQVVPKVDHPWTDGNVLVGFKIDGVEGGPVTLQPGLTYGFTNQGPCNHPLFISNSDQGAGALEIPTGLVYPNGNPFGTCAGQTLLFTPTQAMVGTAIFYQCQVHTRMGGPIFVGSAPTSAASSAGVSTSAAATSAASAASTATVVATSASSQAQSTAASSAAVTSSTGIAEGSNAFSFSPAFFLIALCLFMLRF